MNTATRLRRREKNLVVRFNASGNSVIDLSGTDVTDVIWVKTRLGRSDFMEGRFVRLDEHGTAASWKYTAVEVYKASPKQAAEYLKRSHFVELKPGVDREVFYTINGKRQFLASWGPDCPWSLICKQTGAMAKDAAAHYYTTSPFHGVVEVKLDVNGADLGTYAVTVKLNPEYSVEEL